MNEEEKKALEIIRGLEFDDYEWWVQSDYIKGHADEVVSIVENALNTIIELIEKQQREIEDLKTFTREYEAYELGEGNKIIIASKEWFADGFFKDFLSDYVSKDKIREIISKYVDIEEHLVYHHQELWGADLAEMIKELLGE